MKMAGLLADGRALHCHCGGDVAHAMRFCPASHFRPPAEDRWSERSGYPSARYFIVKRGGRLMILFVKLLSLSRRLRMWALRAAQLGEGMRFT